VSGLLRNLGALLRGLGRPPAVGSTPADVTHREGKWRLLHYRPRLGGLAFQTPVVLVPSLINRHYVLDLLPGKSFVEHLVELGHDVWMIDWGRPGDEDRFLSFDDVCERALGRVLRLVTRQSGRAPHLLGYCLGGTLAAIHAAAHPERVRTLTALAAPIGFRDDGLLATWTRTPSFDVDTLVDALGNVPWQLMQGAFHLLRPTLTLSKLVFLADRAAQTEAAAFDELQEGFLALETWGNDNVSIPGEFYRRYIHELYRGDALLAGTFRLGGGPADLARIRCPTLAVTFEQDSIVPWRSCAVILDRVGSPVKHHLHQPGGHVGGFVSRSAARRVWPPIAAFFAAHDRA